MNPETIPSQTIEVPDSASSEAKYLDVCLRGANFLEGLEELTPSRPVSLAITKVEEALHWLNEVKTEQNNG